MPTPPWLSGRLSTLCHHYIDVVRIHSRNNRDCLLSQKSPCTLQSIGGEVTRNSSVSTFLEKGVSCLVTTTFRLSTSSQSLLKSFDDKSWAIDSHDCSSCRAIDVSSGKAIGVRFNIGCCQRSSLTVGLQTPRQDYDFDLQMLILALLGFFVYLSS